MPIPPEQAELEAALAALEAQPAQSAPYLRAARAYVALAQPNNAQVLLDELLRADEQDVDALSLRGALHAARRAFGEALNDLSMAIDLAPDEARHYLAVARVAQQTGDRRLALNTLAEGLDEVAESDAPPLREARAHLLAAQGSAEALTEAEALAGSLATMPSALRVALAQGWLAAGNAEAALHHAEAARHHDPAHPQADPLHLEALLALERNDVALQTLLALPAPSPDLLNLRGDLLWEQDELAAARVAYEQAWQAAPAHAAAPFNLGLLLLAMGQPGAALRPLDAAVEGEPGDEERWHARSEARRRAGLPYLAWLDADHALALDEEFVEGYQARAEAALALGNADEALEDLDVALTLYPEFGAAHATLARLQAASGLADEARATWQHYLALPPHEQEEATLAEARRSVGSGA